MRFWFRPRPISIFGVVLLVLDALFPLSYSTGSSLLPSSSSISLRDSCFVPRSLYIIFGFPCRVVSVVATI